LIAAKGCPCCRPSDKHWRGSALLNGLKAFLATDTPDFVKIAGAEYHVTQEQLDQMVQLLFPEKAPLYALRIAGVAHPCVAALTTDGIGYILTKAEYHKSGYEVTASFDGDGLGQLMLDRAKALASPWPRNATPGKYTRPGGGRTRPQESPFGKVNREAGPVLAQLRKDSRHLPLTEMPRRSSRFDCRIAAFKGEVASGGASKEVRKPRASWPITGWIIQRCLPVRRMQSAVFC
jgi:hypothetical protein